MVVVVVVVVVVPIKANSISRLKKRRRSHERNAKNASAIISLSLSLSLSLKTVEESLWLPILCKSISPSPSLLSSLSPFSFGTFHLGFRLNPKHLRVCTKKKGKKFSKKKKEKRIFVASKKRERRQAKKKLFVATPLPFPFDIYKKEHTHPEEEGYIYTYRLSRRCPRRRRRL